MSLGRVLALAVLLAWWIGPAPARAQNDTVPVLEPGKAYRGIAVLSSSLGHDVPLEEVETFVRTCRIDLVVVDFAWITHHWPRTDLKSVEELAQRLRRQGVVVAAMYRPRLLGPSDAEVHVARDEEGEEPEHHAELCFAWPDSVDWGAQWGEKVLEGCPSIDHVLLYNVRALCRCEKCRDGAGARHAEEFVGTCRSRWVKTRPSVRVGHVGVGLEYADRVDFLAPFLSVNRKDAAAAVDAAALVAASTALREKVAVKPFVPLAKVAWGDQTTNTTEDVAAVVKACDESKLGFLLWTYEWLFHPDGGRYDPDALVRALGGDPAELQRFLHRSTTAAAEPDGRQWVYFDSRETARPPRLVFVGGDGKESSVAAEADTGLIAYLADRAWGRLPRASVNLCDTNRVLLRFPVERGRRFERADLRFAMHPGDFPPKAPFDVTVHAIEEAWEEATATWNRAPAFATAVAVTASLPPEEREVSIDVTALVHEWTAGRRPNHGLVIKTARRIPEGTTRIAVEDRGATLVRKEIARWNWATTPDAALARGLETKRPVLAVVVASSSGEDLTPHEEILFSTVLSHPAVAELVAARFVPVRVALPAWQFLPEGASAPDPLKALGATAQDAGAPALVVARADGGHVATLASIGTFDHRLVGDFLRDALAKSGGPRLPAEEAPETALGRAERAAGGAGAAAAAARVDRGVALMRLGRFEEAAKALREALPTAGARSNETSYWLGAVLQKRNERGFREILDALAGGDADDPWVRKAATRLAWQVRVGAHESLVDPAVGVAKRRDPDSAVLRAVDFLLREQLSNGSWPVANPWGTDFQAGISVLSAHALFAWLDDLPSPRKEQATLALRKADAWLDANVAKAPPAELNSFAAAYHVDYLLDAFARKRAEREEVVTAVSQLAGGVCPSGAWSYSLGFGRDWKGKERTHSVNTGLAVAVLARAKAAGFAVDAKALAGGVEALAAMRQGPAAYTYTWPGRPNFETDDSSIARAPLCDLALLRVGRASRDDLRATLDVFMERRMDLRATGRTSTPYWLQPHWYTSYFLHFGYYHAAGALAELGDAQAKRDLATLRDDLLGWAEPDGAWVDDLQLGKSYGTAAALLTLRTAGVRLRN